MDRLAAAESQPLLSVQALAAPHGLVTAPLRPLRTGERHLTREDAAPSVPSQAHQWTFQIDVFSDRL